MLTPHVSFDLVVGQLYRSGHPTDLNYDFLESLQLKTIVYVGNSAPEDVAAEYGEWIRARDIRLVRLPMNPVKEPFQGNDPKIVEQTIQYILDERNHPMLVHSDKGKHRVSVVVAAVRKCLQMWALAPIYEEYIRFAKGKVNSDFSFIEQFELSEIEVDPHWFPKWVHLSQPARLLIPEDRQSALN